MRKNGLIIRHLTEKQKEEKVFICLTNKGIKVNNDNHNKAVDSAHCLFP